MYILKAVSFLIVIGVVLVMAIGRPTPSYSKPMSRETKQSIRFTGEPKNKTQAIKRVDRSLKLHGDFGPYGNLTGGLESIMKESKVEIVDMSQKYQVNISPKSNEGHDFSFLVDKNSALISDIVVGNVIPPPK